jgi:hypothetical protein
MPNHSEEALWEQIKNDAGAPKVFEALADPAWDFRTMAGISKSSGLTESEVKTILDKYGPLIRKSTVPATDGSELYTLRSHKIGVQERLAEARMFISKSVK